MEIKGALKSADEAREYVCPIKPHTTRTQGNRTCSGKRCMMWLSIQQFYCTECKRETASPKVSDYCGCENGRSIDMKLGYCGLLNR